MTWHDVAWGHGHECASVNRKASTLPMTFSLNGRVPNSMKIISYEDCSRE